MVVSYRVVRPQRDTAAIQRLGLGPLPLLLVDLGLAEQGPALGVELALLRLEEKPIDAPAHPGELRSIARQGAGLVERGACLLVFAVTYQFLPAPDQLLRLRHHTLALGLGQPEP